MTEKTEVIEIVTKAQITKILRKLYKMHKLTNAMRVQVDKTFALGGRVIGDIGECLASYLFDVKLYAKQTPGADGETADGSKKVEVKVRTETNGEIDDKKIHISKDSFYKKCHIIVFSFDLENKCVTIQVNTPLPNDGGGSRYISFNKLLDGILHKRRYIHALSISENKKGMLAGWTINERVSDNR